MTMELYWASGSPFSWRVMLSLEIKQVPYTGHLMEFSKGEMRAPDYLMLNPRGRVPTLKDGPFVLFESVAILAYLDEKFPDPPLFRCEAEEKALIWRSISECDSYFVPVVFEMALPIFFGKMSDRAEDTRAAATKVRAELDLIERTLGRTPWLAGQTMSAADIVVYPFIELILRAAGVAKREGLDLDFQSFAQQYPVTAGWVDRIKALPGYDKAYPPHWRKVSSSTERAA
jgi:glutathione S-transferase